MLQGATGLAFSIPGVKALKDVPKIDRTKISSWDEVALRNRLGAR
jgi:hypothetical protein